MKPLIEFRVRSPYYTSTPTITNYTPSSISSSWQYFYRGFDITFVNNDNACVIAQVQKELKR